MIESKNRIWGLIGWTFCFVAFLSCRQSPSYDIIIRNGSVYDGSGSGPRRADIGINADTIAFVGDLHSARGAREIRAGGLDVAPGFIDMQSWSVTSLLQDGRSLGAIKQGVTLEVFGEGSSMGPLTDSMKKIDLANQGDIKYPIKWTTLGEYLQYLQDKGVSTNVASFVGAATVRENVLMDENRAPSEAELKQMQNLVVQAMKEGALGVGSALIYAPGFYASTDELVALCQAAAPFGGRYISHIRSEGNKLLEAADELIQISKQAHIPAIFYHLKAAGRSNWHKEDSLIKKIDSARRAGLDISACMYTYTAGATGFDAAMPPSVQEGGIDEWIRRLKNPGIRKRVLREMTTPTDRWENLFLGAGADNIILEGFKQDSLKYLTGKRLTEVAAARGQKPEETIIDLVIGDHSRVEVVYFLMSEDNVKKQLKQPWMSFGSDAASMAPEGVFLKSSTHPRAYGNFSRLLGKYVRDEKVIPMQEAIRRLTSFPASQLNIKKRGSIQVGNYADLAIFDPDSVRDLATYDNPHQLSAGMKYVLVNGEMVLDNGQHTGALPGRFVKGPGYIPGSK